MKVAFYLDNKGIRDIDLSNILYGNPGMGGTEYMLILVSYLLSIRNNHVDIIVYTTHDASNLPLEMHTKKVDNISDAINRATGDGCEYFIFIHKEWYISDRILDVSQDSIKLVPWVHIFMFKPDLDYYADNKAIYRVLHVGREQMDLYRDHRVFKKSLYIYNGINIRTNNELSPINKRKNVVTYMGAIEPYKGLHLLTKAWKHVIKQVPDAELYIIGSGKLYDSNTRLGEYGIAEKKYERELIESLSADGTIPSNVHFVGKLGEEKYAILEQTKVAVPNPSGNTETFCITALEMQLAGARIVTAKSPGTLETVINGVLYTDVRELPQLIIKELNSNVIHDDYISKIEELFSIDRVIEKWEMFLMNGLEEEDKLSNPFYRLIFLKEFFRIVKAHIPCLDRQLPLIEKVILFSERNLYKNKVQYVYRG